MARGLFPICKASLGGISKSVSLTPTSIATSLLVPYTPLLLIVSVFESCWDKVPQTGRLETTEMYRLVILEAGSPESRCWRGLTPPGPRKGIPPGLFQLLAVALAFLGLRLCHAPSPCAFASSYNDASYFALETHPIPVKAHLSVIDSICNNPIFK